MTIFEIHNMIIERFKGYGRLDLLDQYMHAGDGAPTGGEGSGMVRRFLKDLEQNDLPGYKLINDILEQWDKLL